MNKILACNWKMNLSLSEGRELAASLKKLAALTPDVELWVAPQALVLRDLIAAVEKDQPLNLRWGVQNVHSEDKGAFTGELSPVLAKECGASFAIIGHSERRTYFGETDAGVYKRFLGCLRHQLIGIVCIGETLEERKQGETLSVLKQQLAPFVDWHASQGNAPESDLSEKLFAPTLVIAYEPVWAIGTGLTPTLAEVTEAHDFIQGLFKANSASIPPILYGGSVTPDNISGIIKISSVSGCLVGGASLKPESITALALGVAGER
jgi:triosephosphate isomerase